MSEPALGLSKLREAPSTTPRRQEVVITAVDLTVLQWLGVLVRLGAAYLLLLLLFVAVPVVVLTAIGYGLNDRFETAAGR